MLFSTVNLMLKFEGSTIRSADGNIPQPKVGMRQLRRFEGSTIRSADGNFVINHDGIKALEFEGSTIRSADGNRNQETASAYLDMFEGSTIRSADGNLLDIKGYKQSVWVVRRQHHPLGGLKQSLLAAPATVRAFEGSTIRSADGN